MRSIKEILELLDPGDLTDRRDRASVGLERVGTFSSQHAGPVGIKSRRRAKRVCLRVEHICQTVRRMSAYRLYSAYNRPG